MPSKQGTSIEQDKVSTSHALKRAFKKHLAGRLEEAETLYKKVLAAKPDQPEALHMMGLVNQRLGKNGFAKQLINKSLSVRPGNAKARYNLATILKNEGNVTAAVAEYRRTVDTDPNFSEAHNNLGVVLMAQGNPKEAMECYKKAISIKHGHAAAHNNLGNALGALGELKEAIASYQKALSINPDYINARFNLGSTYYDLGHYKNAAANYRAFIAKEPNHKIARNQLGDTFFKLNEFGEALRVFETAKTAHSSARILECLFTLGEYDRFYDTQAQSSDVYKTNIRAAAISAFASQQLGRPDPHPFCKRPLDFVRMYETIEGADQSDGFLDHIIGLLGNMDAVWEPRGRTTKGGFQTRASLFDEPTGHLAQLEQALRKQIEKYADEFAAEDCGFIQSFPKTLNLTGWFVRLAKGGHQTEHLHANGWLSGVFYLRTPKTTNPEEGAIELGLWGYDYPVLNNNYPKQRYYPEQGNLILFPSSLFHRTIPIHSAEDRLSIAFDLLPTETP